MVSIKKIIRCKSTQLLIAIIISCVTQTTFASKGVTIAIDSSKCYIIDNLLNTDWSNTALDSYLQVGTSGTNTFASWKTGTVPAYKLSSRAVANMIPLSYTVKTTRGANYNDTAGYINLKNLYTGSPGAVFDESHVTSFFQLPALPDVGRIVIFLPGRYGSTTNSLIVESLVSGAWTQVAKLTIPTTPTYVYLDTIQGNNIISAAPVTYRFRSGSYNGSSSAGYGPLIGSILVQAYKPEGNAEIIPTHPYFEVTESATSAIAAANAILAKFTENQWLGLVPTQAPRSLQFSPENVNYDAWSWTPDNPDSITCTNSGTKFPNKKFTEYFVSAIPMSGVTLQVPYYKNGGNVTYVKAQIDYQKLAYLRSVLPTLGAAYYYTADERYARYVALIMENLAGKINDFFMTEGWNKSEIVNKNDLQYYYDNALNVQRVSDHNGLASEYSDKELIAFDRIYSSQALRDLSISRGYDVRKYIFENYFLNITDWIIKWRSLREQSLTNLPNYLEVVIRVADMCEDKSKREQILTYVYQLLQIVFQNNFNRDAIYPESFSYHRGYAASMLDILQRFENHFKLFPDDAAKLKTIREYCLGLLSFVQRANQAHKTVAFPDGDMAPFNDTTPGYSDVRDTTVSQILASYQHAMMGDGTGNNQIQVNIGATDNANHIQSNMMHFTLFANGKEQLGDIRYSHIAGRNYTSSTLAHNMVSINGNSSQYYSYARQIPGNDGHVFTNGYLTLFEPNLDGISVTEVYNNTVFLNQGVNRYQRLQLLNTIDITHPYLVDVFVVEGANQHDFILHGSTQTDQSWTASVSMNPMSGTFPLLPPGEVYTDPEGETDSRNWWGVFRNMSMRNITANSNAWNVTYSETAGETNTRIWGLPNQSSTLFMGQTPNSFRRTLAESLYTYWRPTLVERRTGTSLKSIYMHVVEPFTTGKNAILNITRVPLLQNTDSDLISVKVTFIDGREDIILLNLNDKLITGKLPIQTLESTTESCKLTGKAGVIYKPADGSTARGFLINGSLLKYKTNTLSIQTPYVQSTIKSVDRMADGKPLDALISDTIFDSTDLRKRSFVRLTYDTYNIINKPSNFSSPVQKNMSELFEITGLHTENGKTYFHCKNDPYLTVNETSAKELFRPQREFTGKTTFLLTKSKSGYFNATTGTAHSTTKNPDVNIYPTILNPGEKLGIHATVKPESISISDMLGNRMALNAEQNSSELLIPVHLSPGLYLLEMRLTKNTKIIRKLIIK